MAEIVTARKPEHRDRPFSGHWRAPELLAKLNLKPARNVALEAVRSAVIADAIIGTERGQAVSYSRDRTFYPANRRYLTPHATFATVPRTVDELDALGIIISRRAKPGTHGRLQSTFEATQALRDLWIGSPTTFEHDQREAIWLRDDDKRRIAFRETPQTIKLRRIMSEINKGVRQIVVEVPEAHLRGSFLVIAGSKGKAHLMPRPGNTMVRIFNNSSFAHGGRMFGWHQGIPRAARRTMTINGELIAEADFAAMHISILYIKAGLRLDSDAYDVGGACDAGDCALTRKHVKRAVNTMLNAANRNQAAWAIKTELAISFPQALRLIEAVEMRHARISRHFFSGVGMEMMRVESDIMTEVVRNMLAAGIPVLPIHDAALVQGRHYDLLEAEMIAAFERRTGVANVTVQRKG